MITKQNNYWIDENNNKWNANIYTKEQAIKYSRSLVNCNDCSDCSDCSYCNGCNDCSDCSYCNGCSGCRDCSGCSGCRGCSDCNCCNGCNGCRYCSDCSDCNCCRYCSGCSGCSDCSDFKNNPQRYTGQKIGSRNDQTTTYWNEEKNQVVCGCYSNTLDEFEKKVQEIHRNNKYGKQYKKYIAIVRKIMEMENDM